MKHDIQFVETEVNETLTKMVERKLDALGKKFDWIIRADVFFRREKGTYGKGKICEIRLSLPGPRMYASTNGKSFEAAITETVSALEKQLEQRKQEMYAHKL